MVCIPATVDHDADDDENLATLEDQQEKKKKMLFPTPGIYMHTTIVATLRRLSQYSTFPSRSARGIGITKTSTPKTTYFSINPHGQDIKDNHNEEEDQANRPSRKIIRPVLE